MKKKNVNKKKSDKKSKIKKERLDKLIGVDMCACFPIFNGQCKGICRETHTRGQAVNCFCLYRVEDTEEYKNLRRKDKRSKSKTKEVDEFSDKQKRRERFKLKDENRNNI